MIKEKQISNILFFINLFLILNLFVLNINNKVGLLIINLSFLIIFLFKIKYKRDDFYNKKSVMLTMALFALCQIGLFYLSGVKIGFVENAIKLNLKNILNIIAPFIISIIVVEIIRYLLSTYYKDNKKIKILSYIMYVLIDVSLFHFNPNFSYLDSTLEFLGLTLFPSLINNIIFNKIVESYGYKPIIIYRVIIILSYYIFPIIPDMYILFRIVLKIFMPIILILLISYMYDRSEFEELFIKKEKLSISCLVILIILLLFTALISCKFKYGAVTIATGSMTGALNIGDVAIFERYEKQELQINDIIIFDRNGRKVVHRIVEIGRFNNNYVYITKGDYNNTKDKDYVYQKDIKGIVKAKVKYIGYPSVLIRKMFK